VDGAGRGSWVERRANRASELGACHMALASLASLASPDTSASPAAPCRMHRGNPSSARASASYPAEGIRASVGSRTSVGPCSSEDPCRCSSTACAVSCAAPSGTRGPGDGCPCAGRERRRGALCRSSCHSSPVQLWSPRPGLNSTRSRSSGRAQRSTRKDNEPYPGHNILVLHDFAASDCTERVELGP